jgi:Protein of unknown function (DUF3309)
MIVSTPPLVIFGAIVLAALAALPVWPWSRTWGYPNAGAIAAALTVISINALVTHAIA